MIPEGTVAVLHRGALAPGLGHWLWQLDAERYHLVMPAGMEIAEGRNRAANLLKGAWVLFVDSDCIPPPDAIPVLLASCRPLIGGVILERCAEAQICATKTFEPTIRYSLAEINAWGEPRPVLALGTGCLLVRREVLEAVGEPWFRCGQLVVDCIAEDVDFCLRAAERGYSAYLHPGVRVGHQMSGIIWPHEMMGVWVQWEGAPYRQPLRELERVLA